MTAVLTIAEIKQAINYCCAQESHDQGGALCAKARPLADEYGLMIYERATSVAVSRLTPEQVDAVRWARGNQQPPPG